MLMFCNAENVYLLLSGENFPEIRSEFSYIAKCLKGAQNRSPNGTYVTFFFHTSSDHFEKALNSFLRDFKDFFQEANYQVFYLRYVYIH